MAQFVSRKDVMENAYRKVEAMYRNGFSIDEIQRATDLSRMETLDIVQKIFAMDMRRSFKEGLR